MSLSPCPGVRSEEKTSVSELMSGDFPFKTQHVRSDLENRRRASPCFYRVALRQLVSLTWQSAVNFPSEREGKREMEEKEEELTFFFLFFAHPRLHSTLLCLASPLLLVGEAAGSGGSKVNRK